jgi:hypothetical protein
MEINRRTLSISAIIGLIVALINVFFLYEDIQESSSPLTSDLTVFQIVLIPIIFCGTAYWVYQAMEYNKRKYEGVKRPLFRYAFWPVRTFDEFFYYAQLRGITVMIPFLVFFWIVYIGGYSLWFGLILMIFSFMICLIITSKAHHWLDSRERDIEKEKIPYEQLDELGKQKYKEEKRKSLKSSALISILTIFVGSILFYLVDQPDSRFLGMCIPFAIVGFFFIWLILYMIIDEYKTKWKREQ